MTELYSGYDHVAFDEASELLYQQAIAETSLAIVLADPKLPDTPIVFANDAFCKLTGYRRDEIVGKNCRFLQGPGTSKASLDKIRISLQNKFLSVTEVVNYRKDGTLFLNALHIAPLRDLDGNIRLIYGSQMDVTESVTVERLRRKRALNLAGVGIWEFDPEGEDIYLDESARSIYDFEPGADITSLEVLMSKVHAEDQDGLLAAVEAALNHPDGEYRKDFRIALSSGRTRWIRNVGGVSHSSDGSGARKLTGVSFDVTDEMEYELALIQAHDTNKMIADELDHRINNLFSMMAALVSAGARGETDVAKAASKTRERIMAMSRAHSLTIGKGVDGRGSFKNLVDGILAPYTDTATIEVTGNEIPLTQNVLGSLGLILHELATNAAKYGALNNKAGRLSVTWASAPNGLCELNWREKNAKTSTEPVTSTGFGSKLIDLSVAKLGGKFVRDFSSSGLQASLQFPT